MSDRKPKPRPDANGRYQAWFDGREWFIIDPHGSIDDLVSEGRDPNESRGKAINCVMHLNRSRLGIRYDDGDPGCPDFARGWHKEFMRAVRAARGPETEPPEWETVSPFFNTRHEPGVAASEWIKANPLPTTCDRCAGLEGLHNVFVGRPGTAPRVERLCGPCEAALQADGQVVPRGRDGQEIIGCCPPPDPTEASR